MAGNWFCCCGEGITCFPTCFDLSYNLLNLSLYVEYAKNVVPIVSQACCYDLVTHSFNATATPLGQVLVQRFGNPKLGPCCYSGEFTMRITGSFVYGWDFDIQTGPPLHPNCSHSSTINFTVDVPAKIDVYCIGTKWIHEIHICHFQIACNEELNRQDCEGSYPPIGTCATDAIGLRCAGGTIVYQTPLKNLSAITNADVCCTNYCGTPNFGCRTPTLSGMYDYTPLYVGTGPGAFFGVFATEECAFLEEFPPCDNTTPWLGTTATYPSVPYSTDGYWCQYPIDPAVQVGCSEWERYITFNRGQYV